MDIWSRIPIEIKHLVAEENFQHREPWSPRLRTYKKYPVNEEGYCPWSCVLKHWGGTPKEMISYEAVVDFLLEKGVISLEESEDVMYVVAKFMSDWDSGRITNIRAYLGLEEIGSHYWYCLNCGKWAHLDKHDVCVKCAKRRHIPNFCEGCGMLHKVYSYLVPVNGSWRIWDQCEECIVVKATG